MKVFTRSMSLFVLLSLVLSQPLFAEAPDLDKRIEKAQVILDDIMASPDYSIPEEMLAKCKAIAIYPNVLKGAFIFGGRWGQGVVLKRNDWNGKWGPVAFSTIGGASWGFQIGGQLTDLILVVMNDQGLEALLTNNITLGAGVAVTAGPVGRDTQASTDLTLRSGMLAYSKSKGLFGGIALDGAILTQDNRSNERYYGQPVGSADILLGDEVSVQSGSKPLVDALDHYSSLWYKENRARK